MIRLGSNIASLKAQRRLGESSSAQGRALERLSSGMRINRAADDAAGLSVAESLRAGARINTQAIRNINDGMSLLAIAEATVSELSSIITRQKELAEQAANGTYSTAQRASLNKEAAALTAEYNRLIATTSFNGVRVFQEGESRTVIQHGVGSVETTSIDSRAMLGLPPLMSAGDGQAEITVFRVPHFEEAYEAQDPQLLSPYYITLSTPTESYTFWTSRYGEFAPPAVGGELVEVNTGPTPGDAVNQFIAACNATGAFFCEVFDEENGLVRVENSTLGAAPDAFVPGDDPSSFNSITIIQQGADAGMSGSSIYSPGVNLQTQASARIALNTLTTSLQQLAQGMGNTGAIQSRLSVSLETLRVRAENYAAAAGRITDADVAEESAALLRTSILQQTGAAVLAQANQEPALALKLLQASS